jgi:hypothetical protein
MSIQELSAEQLAELFHHYDRALGSDFDCETDQDRESWKDLPVQDKSRMVDAARLAMLELDSQEEKRKNSRRYFAKPGEAEWGC